MSHYESILSKHPEVKVASSRVPTAILEKVRKRRQYHPLEVRLLLAKTLKLRDAYNIIKHLMELQDLGVAQHQLLEIAYKHFDDKHIRPYNDDPMYEEIENAL